MSKNVFNRWHGVLRQSDIFSQHCAHQILCVSLLFTPFGIGTVLSGIAHPTDLSKGVVFNQAIWLLNNLFDIITSHP